MLKNLALAEDKNCLSRIIMDSVKKRGRVGGKKVSGKESKISQRNPRVYEPEAERMPIPYSSTDQPENPKYGVNRSNSQKSNVSILEKAEKNSGYFDILILKYLKHHISDHIKDILRGMDIIRILVQLLEVNLYSSKYGERFDSKIIADLLFFLSWTCDENAENQAIVIQSDHVFDDYLTTELNISETFFLFKSIIKNNKNVLFDENLTNKYLNWVFSILSTIEVKDKRKAY